MWGVGIAAAGAIFAGWNWGYRGSGSYVNASRAVNIDRNFNRNNIGEGGAGGIRWTIEGAWPIGTTPRASNSTRFVPGPSSVGNSGVRSGRMSVYARRLLSSPGKKDELYWETKPGEPPSPLGPLLAKAQPGETQEKGYYGYRFRLLYGQGPDAPGSAYDYLVKGRMIGGFGLIAWAVKYGETGVMTFIASHSGDVYEQDLGPDMAQEAAAINVFNPDKDWAKADMTP